ncbi:SAC domain-containing protein, variant 2 [Balamuthia mandrillaris]
MGQLRGKPVYSVARTAFLPFSTQEITERQKKYQRTYKRVLKQLLESNKDFYFSYEIDLTHSQQRDSQYRAAYNLPLWKRADDRFFWNYFLQQKLMELGLDSWILPVIRGCVQMFTFVLADNIFDFVLISRRSRFRAGTRYNTRGVDPQGRVANFVETEQIINHNGHWTSFVQTRGSIPLFWQQKGYKLKPTPKLSEDATGMADAFTLHFDEQRKLYQQQIVVNLLDRKGSEGRLAEAYEEHLERMNCKDVAYVAYDFHHHCKNDNFENALKLIEQMKTDIQNIGFFKEDPLGRRKQEQVGVIRTNCLDCLDRTNLIQSLIAFQSLEFQMQSFGVQINGASGETLDKGKQGQFDRLFKEAWANNGDFVSLQYAGTGALKGDFTRTGKRKMKGKLNDGYNALSRYVINNFHDRLRQIAVDLFLGRMDVDLDNWNTEDSLQIWTNSHMDAIYTCTELLFQSEHKDETFVDGWVLISINKRGQEQERILLLTEKACYRCKYNFREEKIIRFKRLALDSISGIFKGYYGMEPVTATAASSATNTPSEDTGNSSNGSSTEEILPSTSPPSSTPSTPRKGGSSRRQHSSSTKRRPCYGMALVCKDVKKPFHYYRALAPSNAPPELETAMILEVVASFAEVQYDNEHEFFVEETTLSKPSTKGVTGVYSKAFNSLGLGMYRKSKGSSRQKSSSLKSRSSPSFNALTSLSSSPSSPTSSPPSSFRVRSGSPSASASPSIPAPGSYRELRSNSSDSS